MPARTQATDAAGFRAAMIRPIPSTAAAAEPLVPTCWSMALNEGRTTVPAAPPRRPMPISSIPIRRISGLIGAGSMRRGTALGRIRLDSMSMPNDVPITPEGLQAVERELDELTTVKRPSIVSKIKAARELGDLSENFEYHAAKNEQGMMEARIRVLRHRLQHATILDEAEAAKSGVVTVGSKVSLERDDGTTMEVEITSVGGVSPDSPVGQAL